jgi:hypothetical protein
MVTNSAYLWRAGPRRVVCRRRILQRYEESALVQVRERYVTVVSRGSDLGGATRGRRARGRLLSPPGTLVVCAGASSAVVAGTVNSETGYLRYHSHYSYR